MGAKKLDWARINKIENCNKYKTKIMWDTIINVPNRISRKKITRVENVKEVKD